MGETTGRRVQAVDVAADLFRRHGYSRTTMADIARGASMSRPTLYSEFPDKDAVFAAVLESMTVALVAEIEAEVGRCGSLVSRVERACSLWVLAGYELVQANPDAADMFDARFPAVRASNRVFEDFLTGLFGGVVGVPRELEPRRLAEVVNLSLQGIKKFAVSRGHLDDLIVTLVMAVCASVTEGGSRPR
ncbi:AcrR family transcriptional regulator [Rhodococcus sp. 27YEA15]|uniref:TetR/AcrR family transcriptional regulator n=1 Tax=Rhodococcus sp. 27YEA15 TaxID=3156259 RepID=UPI003C7C997A